MSAAATATKEGQPSQLHLIEEPEWWGVDVSALKRRTEELRTEGTHSPRTQKEYASDWKHFHNWCSEARRDALPASEETVEMYLAHYSVVHKIATLRRRVSAIAQRHEQAGHASPVGKRARQVLRGIARRTGSAPMQKAAITPEQLREMVEALDGRTAIGSRDRSLLVIGFATGLRRSNLSALQVADVRPVKEGLIVHVPREKNDQEGNGRYIGVFPGRRASTCPVRALKQWFRFRGKAAGPLFTRLDVSRPEGLEPITPETINAIVKRAAESIGLNPADYGAHSLRAGMVTAAHLAGSSDMAVAKRSGHKSVENLAKYVRSAEMFAFNPLARAL